SIFGDCRSLDVGECRIRFQICCSHFFPALFPALGVVRRRGTLACFSTQSSGPLGKPTTSKMEAWRWVSGVGIASCIGLRYRSTRPLPRLVGYVANDWDSPGDRRGADFIG